MPKKRRHDRHEPTPADDLVQPTPEEQTEIETWAEPEAPAPRTFSPLAEMLNSIRAEAKESRRHTAHTISELEQWRAELDAAIAYLKGKA